MAINFISVMVKAKEPTTVEDVIDHIDHVRDLVAIEHVGIGSDRPRKQRSRRRQRRVPPVMTNADRRYRVHVREAVEDLEHPLRFFTLTEALIRRGYTNDRIMLVLGENLRRVLSTVWQRA